MHMLLITSTQSNAHELLNFVLMHYNESFTQATNRMERTYFFSDNRLHTEISVLFISQFLKLYDFCEISAAHSARIEDILIT